MARELDIIPNLKWLVKQINNISLDKEQITLFNNSTINTYNLQPGFLLITATPIFNAAFPDPALSKGASMIIYVGNNISNIPVFQNGYEPYDLNISGPLQTITGNILHKYYSTGAQWVGGVHFT